MEQYDSLAAEVVPWILNSVNSLRLSGVHEYRIYVLLPAYLEDAVWAYLRSRYPFPYAEWNGPLRIDDALTFFVSPDNRAYVFHREWMIMDEPDLFHQYELSK